MAPCQRPPQERIFARYIRIFEQRIGRVRGLEQSGEIDAQKAYEVIVLLWQQLQQTKHDLGIVSEPELSFSTFSH